MAASFETISEIIKVMKRHCSRDQIQKIIDDLLKVKGNNSFQQTILRIAKEINNDI